MICRKLRIFNRELLIGNRQFIGLIYSFTLMEIVLLTIWKGIVILAALVFVLIVAYRTASAFLRFAKRKFSPRKRTTRAVSSTKTNNAYATPAIEKI